MLMTAHLDVPGQVFYEKDTPRTFQEFFEGFHCDFPIVWHADRHVDTDLKCLKVEGHTDDVMRIMHFWTYRINRFMQANGIEQGESDLNIGEISYEGRSGKALPPAQ